MSSNIIKDLKSKPEYRKFIIESLCQRQRDLESLLYYIVDEKLHIFDIDDLQGSFYYEDDETLDLILPTIARVWGKVFIDPPSILKDKKLELFQLLFDIDDFLDYLLEIIPKVKTSLIEFDKLDRTAETLVLIVDNYIAGLLETTRNREDIQQEIRDLRISKTLKKW
jgi:hypothetical protein